MELLIGCGNQRDKRIYAGPVPAKWRQLVTLDIDPSCKPDVVADLEDGLPFADHIFDEVHAYEVMEHYGRQGDYRTFFRHFGEIYRVLKAGGFLCGTSPKWDGQWAWGDPGHRRIVSPQALLFLDQNKYAKEVGITSMTDYRWLWKGDFRFVATQEIGDSHAWILQAYPQP